MSERRQTALRRAAAQSHFKRPPPFAPFRPPRARVLIGSLRSI